MSRPSPYGRITSILGASDERVRREFADLQRRQLGTDASTAADREHKLAEIRERIVQASLVWYESTNEAELAAAVQEYKHVLALKPSEERSP